MGRRIFGIISFSSGIVLTLIGVVFLFLFIDTHYRINEFSYLFISLSGTSLFVGSILFVLGLVILIISRKKKENGMDDF